jgi:O-acetyl-ADP-ribose deacetylase (regulator of RNase III)
MPFEVEIIMGDIIATDVEVIVNAANNNFWMGSGVAGVIKRAAGPSVEEDAMTKGPVMPGEAVFSTAGRLPYNYIIHAAVMGQDLRTNQKLIRQATVASLVLADGLKVKSIAFPAFGTGVGGFPMAACARIMTTTVNGYQALSKHLERVQFCTFDALGHDAFSRAREELQKR